MDDGQGWDEYMFKGTAPYYERGRPAYADRLGDVLRAELGTTGDGTLIDFGSGPGTLAVPLAAQFRDVLAVEPDPELAALGARKSAAAAPNVRWQVAPAETVRLEPASVDVALFGQSFHWMDRPLIAERLRTALRPGGHVVLISDVKGMTGPTPVPKKEIDALVAEYLGTERRAGRRTLPNGTPSDEAEVLAQAGFAGPRRVVVDNPGTAFRDVDTIVADVYSRSNSARHLFGDRIDEFDERLRALLTERAVDGGYQVDRPATDVRIWTNPA